MAARPGRARRLERLPPQNTQLVRLGIVIDFHALVRRVPAGGGDLGEDVRAEIAVGPAQEIHSRGHAREIVEVRTTYRWFNVLQHEDRDNQIEPVVPHCVPVVFQRIGAFGRERAALLDHRRQIESSDVARNRAEERKGPADAAAEIEHAIDLRGERDRGNVGREGLTGLEAGEDVFADVVRVARTRNRQPVLAARHLAQCIRRLRAERYSRRAFPREVRGSKNEMRPVGGRAT